MNALNNELYPTEVGASIFVDVNSILSDAAKEFGLLHADTCDILESKYEFGVWDGERFVYKQGSDSNSWWDIAKLVWKYGLAPIKTQKLMRSTVGKFLGMYEEPNFPFADLSEAVKAVGLTDTTAVSGRELLKKEGISEKFSRELIQASTRVNYGQNLPIIHGVETMVCMAANGAHATDGGNWQIFDRMLQASNAEIYLNTSVTAVHKESDGRYALSLERSSKQEETRQEEDVIVSHGYDAVILAAPYQFANISFSPSLQHVPDEIPYVTLPVTLFTSRHRLNPRMFDLQSVDEIPEMILTTLPDGEDLNVGVGPAEFWSISTLRTVENKGHIEYLYKIFSPEPLTAQFLAKMLDIDEPEAGDTFSTKDVSWMHEKVWKSYPYELPRVTFEHIRLDYEYVRQRAGGGVWYTSGIESFISTMETSALMGKNIARLIADEVAAG